MKLFKIVVFAAMAMVSSVSAQAAVVSSTMGAKLMTGIALGFGFYILNQMFGFVSQVYQIPPLIGATTPLLVFTVFGLMLLKRSR